MYETEGPTGRQQHSGRIPYLLGVKGRSGYGSGATSSQVLKDWRGEGKVVIITGSNTGLGKETARALAAQGAEVIMAVRNTELGEAAAADIRSKHPEAKLVVMACDLASLASAKKFADEFKKTGKPLHVLMCNAGDKSGSDTRLVVLSSAAHFSPYKPKQGPGPIRFDNIDDEEGYDKWGAYGQSKLCNVLFTRELHRRLTEEKAPVTAVVCHPGVIMTELMKYMRNDMNPCLRVVLPPMVNWAFKSVSQGAATQVYLATAPNVKGGEYYADCNFSPSTAAACDDSLGKKLWELSEQMVSAAGLQA